jgi:hydrocephalus-inducing protein
MVFEYTPDSEDIAESFFTFRIVEQGIAVPFLLVGHVVEPSVAFDVASINFGKVLVGSRSRETVMLSNNEHIPFGFNFDKATFEMPGGVKGAKAVLAFEPSSGTVPPNSSIPVVVTFVPDLEKSLNYNVVATVRKKPSRLTLNVKGEGYAIHETLEVESSVPGEVRPMQLAAVPSKNAVDLGQVLINERCVRQVSFVNSGEINFDFAWDCGTNPRVSVKPETATVGKGERLVCELAYAPSAAETLDNYKVTCGIINGRKYTLNLNAVGHRPALKFSFHSFDFGPAFVHQAGMPARTQTLTISNDDEKPFAIDCLFDSAAMPFLQLGDAPTMLAPGHSADMTVSFSPREAKDYRAVIPFQINGLYTVNVAVTGEVGTLYKLNPVYL